MSTPARTSSNGAGNGGGSGGGCNGAHRGSEGGGGSGGGARSEKTPKVGVARRTPSVNSHNQPRSRVAISRFPSDSPPSSDIEMESEMDDYDMDLVNPSSGNRGRHLNTSLGNITSEKRKRRRIQEFSDQDELVNRLYLYFNLIS